MFYILLIFEMFYFLLMFQWSCLSVLRVFFFFKFWNQYTYLFLVCSDFLFLHELALAAHVFSMNLSISFILSNLSTCNCSHHALLLLLLFISVKLVVSSPFSFLILVTWDFSLFSWSSSLKFCQCCWSQRRNFCLWFSLLFFYTVSLFYIFVSWSVFAFLFCYYRWFMVVF